MVENRNAYKRTIKEKKLSNSIKNLKEKEVIVTNEISNEMQMYGDIYLINKLICLMGLMWDKQSITEN